MEKSQKILESSRGRTPFLADIHIYPMHYGVSYVEWQSINPNRFSEGRRSKIIDKLRRPKAIRNIVIVSFLTLLAFAFLVFIVAFIGSIVRNEALTMMLGACAGIGLVLFKDLTVDKFPIRKREHGLYVWHKGKKYNYMDRIVN